MENVASVWLLFGIGLIALNAFSHNFSRSGAPGRLFKFIGARYIFFSFTRPVCHKSAVRTGFRRFKLLIGARWTQRRVALIATALVLIFGRHAFSMSCNATSPITQDCAVVLTWQDNSSGNNQEDFVDIYLTVGATAVSKVATVASDVVSFVHNAVGMGAGAQLCYQVQAGNNVGLSSFSNIACATTPAIVFVTAPNAPANLVVQ
ncbi:MAG TPA: hypothetical protein VF452_12615 [Candidatus Binatia bacterium]